MMEKKIRLYIVDLENILESPLDDILPFFNASGQARIKKYRFVADQNRTAWAEILLRYLLPEGLRKKEIVRDERGKPYLLESDLQFNLSHSGRWVACSIGETLNGVDVQKEEEKIPLSVAKKYYAPREYEELLSLEETKKREVFYKWWSVKESYLKMTGQGLAGSLKDVDSRALLEGKGGIGCNAFLLRGGYHLAISGRKNSLPEKYQEITYKILQEFWLS